MTSMITQIAKLFYMTENKTSACWGWWGYKAAFSGGSPAKQ